MGSKSIHFLDKDGRLYAIGAKATLNGGLKALQAFKKEMGFGQKVVKLKQGNRRDFKKYMYNWAYFYICFLLYSMPRLTRLIY